jgi:hypothetical protein
MIMDSPVLPEARRLLRESFTSNVLTNFVFHKIHLTGRGFFWVGELK